MRRLVKPENQPTCVKTRWGGRRRGAGRPNRSGLQAHVRRAKLTGHQPVHVTLRLVPGLPSLRRKDVFRVLQQAVRRARSKGFGAAHFAILSNHVHLILEPDRKGPGRAIQSLGISFARRLNGLLGRQGAVFRERYHMRVLESPMQAHNTLAYVLCNESRHRRKALAAEDLRGAKKPRRIGPPGFDIRLDPFSSAYAFSNWKWLLGRRPRVELTSWSQNWIAGWLDEILVPPRTWLLTRGWIGAGLLPIHRPSEVG